MYHDDFGFDALPLQSPLERTVRGGGLWLREQDYANKLLGLLLASELFSARSPGARPLLEDAPLATSWPEVTVRFSGEILDQDDLDTLLGCLLLTFGNPGRSSGATRFSLHDLVKRIRSKGRRLTAHSVERSLWRLAGASLAIDNEADHIRIRLRLVHALLCDNANGVCSLELNPRLLEGFRSSTNVERLLAIRAPLGATPFPRWLAGLLANSTGCLCLELDGLRRLCGLGHQAMAAFRERVNAALQAFSELGYIAAIDQNGPDRLVVTHHVARGEQSACLLVS